MIVFETPAAIAPRWSPRWRNFSPEEFACGCHRRAGGFAHCRGEVPWWPEFFARAQIAREIYGAPIVLNSARRCHRRNVRVGGVPRSEHKRLAIDIRAPATREERARLYHALRVAGFTGFGFYQSFIHADLGRPREWASGGRWEIKERWADL